MRRLLRLSSLLGLGFLLIGTTFTTAARVTFQEGFSFYLHPNWSPSGTQIAFADVDLSRSLDRSDIWVINEDGTKLKNLTPDTDDFVDWRPRWSPDDEHIAFASNRATQDIHIFDLWVMDSNGLHVENLTLNIEGTVRDYAWSGDSKYIAFSSAPTVPTSPKTMDYGSVWLFDVESREVQSLYTPQQDTYYSNPIWSPRSNKMVIFITQSLQTPNGGILIFEPNISHQTLLFADILGHHLIWSPIDENVFLVSGDEVPFYSEIRLFNVETKQYSDILSDGESYRVGIDWSPNGKYIAYTSLSEDFERTETKIIDLEIETIFNLSEKMGTNYVVSDTSFSPDSKRIAITATQDRLQIASLWIADIETGELRYLTGEGTPPDTND